jgi:biopolymer transport protein ExbD
VSRRGRAEEEASLNMTPLIDMVLLLLIFYIVTTAFVDREIELKLPESDTSAIPEEKRKFIIELGRRPDELAINGERTTVAKIDRIIEIAAAADDIQSVEIRADELVIHRRVVEVLGVVKKYNVDAVGIAVQQKSPQS